MMRRERAAGINSGSHYTVLFFSAYFIYYAAYCIFSSYTVLFLTERAYSATVCGIITSLTFLANLLMEPVGGFRNGDVVPLAVPSPVRFSADGYENGRGK